MAWICSGCGTKKKTNIGDLCRPCTNLAMRTDTQYDHCVDCGKLKSRNQYRRCKSCATKRDWEKEEFRKKQNAKDAWPEERREAHSKRIKELWQDEEWRTSYLLARADGLSSETKEKMAANMAKRWEDSEYRQERVQAALDMWDDPKMRRKILLARDGFILRDEDRHYPERFGNRLKEEIRTRERRHCALCGCPESDMSHRLHVHHINAQKEDCRRLNLVALCKKCHNLVGRKRTRLYWQKHLAFQVALKYG